MLKGLLVFASAFASINPDLWMPIDYKSVLNPIVKARIIEDQDLYTLLTYNFELNNVIVNCSLPQKFIRLGWSPLFSHQKNKKLSQILKIGRKCCDIEDCNKTVFNNFKSCCDNRKSCENAHLYFPRILKPSFSSVSHCDSQTFRHYYGRSYTLFNQSDSDWPYGTF